MALIEQVKSQRRKSKSLILALTGSFLLCALSFQQVRAQTFAEWFSQKKTQIKYLTEQISALEQYGSYVKQGYQIAQNGWGGIGNWVKGEYNLHSAYYTSLKTVNQAISNDPKADSIVSTAQLIPRQFDQLNGLSALDNDNREYISRVKTKVLSETDKDVAELQLVLTNGRAQLTDDERIKRLDAIYFQVSEKLVFSRSFCNAIRLLLIQRNQQLQDIQTIGRLYEIN